MQSTLKPFLLAIEYSTPKKRINASDAVLVEAMLFMTRREVSGLELVAKRFCRLIRSHPIPLLHVFYELTMNRMTDGPLECKGHLGASLLWLNNIDISSAEALALIDSSYYVRFQYVLFNFNCSETSTENMLWLRELRHTFVSCSVYIFHCDSPSIVAGCAENGDIDAEYELEVIDEQMIKRRMEEILEIFVECNSIVVDRTDGNSFEHSDHPMAVSTLIRWLHSGGIASRTLYDDEVGEFMFRGRLRIVTLAYAGLKMAKLDYHLNRYLYNELRKELSEAFLSDREEHCYCLTLQSLSPHHAAKDEGYEDLLENLFTGEELYFTTEYEEVAEWGVYEHSVWRMSKTFIEYLRKNPEILSSMKDERTWSIVKTVRVKSLE